MKWNDYVLLILIREKYQLYEITNGIEGPWQETENRSVCDRELRFDLEFSEFYLYFDRKGYILNRKHISDT